MQEYLNGLATVTALHSLLAQFLKVEQKVLGGQQRVGGGEGQGVGTGRVSRENAAAFIASLNLANLEHTNTKQVQHPPSCASNVKTGMNMKAIQGSVPAKGNDDEASRRAYRERQAFLKKHAGLLESLLPGRTLHLSPDTDSVNISKRDSLTSVDGEYE